MTFHTPTEIARFIVRARRRMKRGRGDTGGWPCDRETASLAEAYLDARAELMHWRSFAFLVEALQALDSIKEPKPAWVAMGAAPLYRLYALLGKGRGRKRTP